MGVQSIVHGRILLKGNFQKSKEYLHSLKNDDNYPWIRTEMFSFGAEEKPYYYDKPVLSFGATYKGVESDWKSFIIKFENILRNIEFDNAKIQLETEFYGTYNFFWKKRTDRDNFEANEKLIETKEWFFGYGYRCRWGLLDEELKDEHIFKINFEYPIKFKNSILEAFNDFLTKIETVENNKVIYLNDYLDYNIIYDDDLYPILIYLKTKNMIRFSFEDGGKRYWIKKLKPINKIANAQQFV